MIFYKSILEKNCNILLLCYNKTMYKNVKASKNRKRKNKERTIFAL